MPDIATDWIRRCDVRDTAPEIESEFESTVDQVQTYEIAPAVVQLAVIKQETVVRASEEPQFDGERFRDAFQARQLQISVTIHLRNQQFRQFGVH